jgi:hypothetical protein
VFQAWTKRRSYIPVEEKEITSWADFLPMGNTNWADQVDAELEAKKEEVEKSGKEHPVGNYEDVEKASQEALALKSIQDQIEAISQKPDGYQELMSIASKGKKSVASTFKKGNVVKATDILTALSSKLEAMKPALIAKMKKEGDEYVFDADDFSATVPVSSLQYAPTIALRAEDDIIVVGHPEVTVEVIKKKITSGPGKTTTSKVKFLRKPIHANTKPKKKAGVGKKQAIQQDRSSKRAAKFATSDVESEFEYSSNYESDYYNSD